MKIVIMAGGKGTRIASVNSEVPKPMIPILSKPILQYQVESLAKQGYTDFIFVIGYLGDIIKSYFKDGSDYGVNIQYIVEKKPLGTAGALYYLKDIIKEDFLLINGDIIFDVDIHRFLSYHKSCGGIATILTHPNSHPYDSALIETDNCGMVTRWIHKEDERIWYKNRVNAGLHMLSRDIFNYFQSLQKKDLDRDILQKLIESESLYAYDTPEYVKDMGTPDRYEMVSHDILEGRVTLKNLLHKQKAVFLDRDGTINKYVGFLTDISQMELIDGVATTIRKLNESGFLVIVITNQPVIARGDITADELDMIHRKMETLLGQEGAYIDDIFYCPHHPDRGFAGERIEYKVTCTCRKPEPGLILRAAQKYNIDLTKSYMIGDSMNDVMAGKNAGCQTLLLDATKKMETSSPVISKLQELFSYIK